MEATETKTETEAPGPPRPGKYELGSGAMLVPVGDVCVNSSPVTHPPLLQLVHTCGRLSVFATVVSLWDDPRKERV
jgi:hypothetical protein